MSDKQPKKVSLGSIEQALSHWRANKDKYPDSGIPNEIWLQIFLLEDESRYTGSKIRTIFSLNSQQYKKKRDELTAKTVEEKPIVESTQPPPEPFAQVCVENSNVPPLSSNAQISKDIIKNIKATKTETGHFLDPTTIVVECIRQDGQRLKIHTCTQQIDVILHTFYKSSGDV